MALKPKIGMRVRRLETEYSEALGSEVYKITHIQQVSITGNIEIRVAHHNKKHVDKWWYFKYFEVIESKQSRNIPWL